MEYLVFITCEEKFLFNKRWVLSIINQSCKKKHGLLSDKLERKYYALFGRNID